MFCLKSCYDDYKTDKKWTKYLDKCNKFYLCISEQFWKSKHGRILELDAKAEGVGVLVLSENSGYLEAKVKAKSYKLEDSTVLRLALKMVWRYGKNASNTRRRRQFLR